MGEVTVKVWSKNNIEFIHNGDYVAAAYKNKKDIVTYMGIPLLKWKFEVFSYEYPRKVLYSSTTNTTPGWTEKDMEAWYSQELGNAKHVLETKFNKKEEAMLNSNRIKEIQNHYSTHASAMKPHEFMELFELAQEGRRHRDNPPVTPAKITLQLPPEIVAHFNNLVLEAKDAQQVVEGGANHESWLRGKLVKLARLITELDAYARCKGLL